MINCPICIAGRRDDVSAMLEEVGVGGAALAAVHEILAPCRPDEPCRERIRQAVEAAAASLRCRAGPGHDPRAAAAAMLALLATLGDPPLETITTHVCDECSGRCNRRGPGGKMWQKAMTGLRDELIGAADGRLLVLECEPDGAALSVRQERRDGAVTSSLTLARDEATHLPDVAARLRRLCVLAIVKKVGRRVAPTRRTPLRVGGLRVRGDTAAWSALHNGLGYPIR